MTQVAHSRRRIVRVRRIRLKAETISLAVARSQLEKLEQHRIAIATLVENIMPIAGVGRGHMLASTIELRDRLLEASLTLNGRLAVERASVVHQENRYLAADRDTQLAERLLARAARAAEQVTERRRIVPARRRNDHDGSSA